MPLDILLVESESELRATVSTALATAEHRVATASDGARAMELLVERDFDVVLCDVELPKVGGLSIFAHLRRHSPRTDVILIAGRGSVQDAGKALKEGATDYLAKPLSLPRLLHDLERIAERRALQHELQRIRSALDPKLPSISIIGRSAIMQRLLQRVETLAASDAPVMVEGESGTGKELVARALHANSPRRARPLVTINCASFPETLIEAELFGHERGAFTGAFKRRHGRFKAADGGTLFLDEVAELPLPAQAKLLRVLQEGTFEPLGSNETVKVNVRIISATHQPLKQLVAERRFREDLYYRLKVLHVRIPPLRERRSDVPALVDHFLGRFDSNRQITGLSPRAWAALSHHDYPGNVRELEHAIHHAVVLAGWGDIDLHHLPDELGELGVELPEPPREANVQPLATAARQFEREYLLRALEATSGNRGNAAALLGISRKNLWEKLRRHGITWPTSRGDATHRDDA